MAATREAKLPKHMQDEVWMIMHMVAELGAHPGSMKCSLRFLVHFASIIYVYTFSF